MLCSWGRISRILIYGECVTEVCEAERNWREKLNPANWLVNSRRTRQTGCCGFFCEALRPKNRQNLVPKRYLLISCRNYGSISFSDTVNRVSSETFRCSKSTWALLSMEVAPEFKMERSGASMSLFLKKKNCRLSLRPFFWHLVNFCKERFPSQIVIDKGHVIESWSKFTCNAFCWWCCKIW